MANLPVNKNAHAFDKTRFESVMNRRFFYAPAFEIYGGKFPRVKIGVLYQVLAHFLLRPIYHPYWMLTSIRYAGVAGLYDYGPPGSSLQANIIAEWRRHFIVEESMLEIDSTIMTPAPVFETSGHVARFADWMVKDEKTGDVLRADHLVEGVLEARLAGDKEARGLAAQPVKEDPKKKKKKDVKAAPVQLADAVVAEYEKVLAQVRIWRMHSSYLFSNIATDRQLLWP